MDIILETKDLTKTYKAGNNHINAVDHTSICVERGDFEWREIVNPRYYRRKVRLRKKHIASFNRRTGLSYFWRSLDR